MDVTSYLKFKKKTDGSRDLDYFELKSLSYRINEAKEELDRLEDKIADSKPKHRWDLKCQNIDQTKRNLDGLLQKLKPSMNKQKYEMSDSDCNAVCDVSLFLRYFEIALIRDIKPTDKPIEFIALEKYSRLMNKLAVSDYLHKTKLYAFIEGGVKKTKIVNRSKNAVLTFNRSEKTNLKRHEIFGNNYVNLVYSKFCDVAPIYHPEGRLMDEKDWVVSLKNSKRSKVEGKNKDNLEITCEYVGEFLRDKDIKLPKKNNTTKTEPLKIKCYAAEQVSENAAHLALGFSNPKEAIFVYETSTGKLFYNKENTAAANFARYFRPEKEPGKYDFVDKLAKKGRVTQEKLESVLSDEAIDKLLDSGKIEQTVGDIDGYKVNKVVNGRVYV